MDWVSAAVVLAVCVGAACQVFTGIGFALVCSPILVLVLGHEQGVRVVLIMSSVLNAYVLVRSFRHVRVGDAIALLVPAALIIMPAVALAATVRVPVLTLSAGVVIVLATALVVQNKPLPWLDGWPGALGIGVVSGVFNVVAAASGPPTALFAVQRGWSPAVTRATLQAFALPLNLVTLLLLGTSPAVLSGLGWAVGGLLAGTVGASLVTHRAPSEFVRRVTLTLAAFGGATLLVTGTWALLR